MTASIILGTGSYTPDKIITNDDMSKIVDTSDEWIKTRTGIRQRRFAADDEASSDMALKAANKAIINAGIDKNAIDCIIVATMTPICPSRLLPAFCNTRWGFLISLLLMFKPLVQALFMHSILQIR